MLHPQPTTLSFFVTIHNRTCNDHRNVARRVQTFLLIVDEKHAVTPLLTVSTGRSSVGCKHDVFHWEQTPSILESNIHRNVPPLINNYIQSSMGHDVFLWNCSTYHNSLEGYVFYDRIKRATRNFLTRSSLMNSTTCSRS